MAMLQAVISICLTTIVWFTVALVTAPESEATLCNFYRRARPLGLWGPIRDYSSQRRRDSSTRSAIAAGWDTHRNCWGGLDRVGSIRTLAISSGSIWQFACLGTRCRRRGSLIPATFSLAYQTDGGFPTRRPPVKGPRFTEQQLMKLYSNTSLRFLPASISYYLVLALLAALLVSPIGAMSAETIELNDYDVVIAGGSTAALAAALSSAKSGAKTALLEPTDWIGGQLTSSGVPAVDEAWHTIRDPETKEPLLNVAKLARDPRNMTPNFRKSLEDIADCGDCWVSRYCFRPSLYLEQQLLPLQKEAGENLTVFLETVVKQVEVDTNTGKILSLTAIRRIQAESVEAGGYDRLPSADIPDWYSPEPSPRFSKEVIRFGSNEGQSPQYLLMPPNGANYWPCQEPTSCKVLKITKEKLRE